MPYLQILVTYFGFLAFGGLLAAARRWVRPAIKTPSALKKGPVYILLNIIFLTAIWLPRETHSLTLVIAVLAASVSWEISCALRLRPQFCLLQSFITGRLIFIADWLSISSFMRLWSIVILLALPIVSMLFTTQIPLKMVGARISPAPVFHTGSNSNFRHQALGPALLNLAAGQVYLPFCLVPLLWLWHSDVSGYKITFFYLVIAINDAFSQFIGQLVGHTPLAPVVSPSKTIEGSIGGIFFATLLGICLSGFVGWSILQATLMAIIIAFAGQVGDLIESSWKRALGVKDLSSAMGAHGGVLDRFDALIYSAPVFWLLTSLSFWSSNRG